MSLRDDTVSTMPLLKTMMMPEISKSDQAPDVGLDTLGSVGSSVDYNLSYVVAADISATLPVTTVLNVTASDYAVPGTGLLLSFPKASVDAVYHCGIVPGGPATNIHVASDVFANRPTTAQLRGLDISSHYYGASAAGGATTNYNAYAFEFFDDVVLPRVGQGVGIQISPDLSENFSSVRQYARILKLYSTTRSGSNIDLAGTCTTGVFEDIRDILQVMGTNGVRRAFPQSAMAQQSTSRQDVLKAVSIKHGIVNLMGPDYPRAWQAPDTQRTDILKAEFLRFENLATWPWPTTQYQWAADRVQHGTQTWFTPYNTRMYVSNYTTGSGAPGGYQVIQTPSINVDGVLDVDYSFGLHFNVPSWTMGMDPMIIKVTANAIHVFATLGADGFVRYVLADESQTFEVANNESFFQLLLTGVPDPLIAERYTAKFRPRMLRNGVAVNDGGFYLGTLVTTSWICVRRGGIAVTDTVQVQFQGVSAQVRARSVDADGRLEAHVIRYDDVTEGQQVQFQGVGLLQSLAKGSLAPFVRGSAMVTVPDSTFSKLVNTLWQFTSQFRRMYIMSDYATRIVPFMQSATADSIIDLLQGADRVTQKVAEAAGNAAGVFGNLLGGVGGLLGGRDGNVIGSALGGVGDALFGGAAGQFSSGADGATGGAHGSFGYQGSAAGGFRRRRGD